MSDAPERIALKKTDGYETNWYGVVTDIHDERGVEYIRADLAPTDAQVMAHPKVRALVENAKAEAAACVIYLTTALDRGGRHGPKGKSRKALEQAHLRLCAALRDMEDSNG